MLVSQVWGEALARFTIASPHGKVITTSNSLFWIELDEQKTRVTCVSGSVGVQALKADEITRIPPGFIWEWSAYNSSLVAADTDARAQDELREGLETEETLRGLSNQKRDLLPR